MILEQFNFLQPLWFLALLPLLLILWLLSRSASDSKAWAKVIDAKLLPLLLQGEDKKTGKLAKMLLAIGWLICVVALADPVWEKVSRPIFQTNTARVIVLDLSNSMLIDDLKPSRLARARFKVEDILSREEEGQTGLVLFAGDAFTVSPLTRDTETIRSLLKILTPQLLPAQGSRVDLGLNKAHELLKQSGVNNGQVLLIADGVSDNNLAIDAAESLAKDGHTVSVLGVGTEEGGILKFRNRNDITVKLESNNLTAIAQQGGGNYHLISANNADLQHLLSVQLDTKSKDDNELQKQDINSEQWKSTGPFLVLLLLPLAALAFRRGWLLNIFFAFFIVGTLIQPQTAMAFSLDNLWKNKEQQADAALHQQQYEKVGGLSKDPMRRGSAEYKQEKYSEALESFKKGKGANARYNEGNTLAKLKKYKDAIAAYDKAIELKADMKDAIENKAAIEKLLKKQQQKSDQSKSKEQQDKDSEQKSEVSKKDQQQANDDSENSPDKKTDNKKDQQKQSDQAGDKQNEQEQKNGKAGDKKKDSEKSAESKKDENQFSDANKELDKKTKDKEPKPSENDAKSAAENKQNKDHNQSEPGNKSEDKADSNKNDIKRGDKENSGTKDENNELNKSKLSEEEAKELTKEEKMAAEQWLRRIPDDPGGLLRRKFRYQYRQRRNSTRTEQPW